jgi:nucleoside phosphorylase
VLVCRNLLHLISTLQAHFSLLASASALMNDAKDYEKRREAARVANSKECGSASSYRPAAHIGTKEVLASGHFVMKSAAFAQQLRRMHPKLSAVDMEAKGYSMRSGSR